MTEIKPLARVERSKLNYNSYVVVSDHGPLVGDIQDQVRAGTVCDNFNNVYEARVRPLVEVLETADRFFQEFHPSLGIDETDWAFVSRMIQMRLDAVRDTARKALEEFSHGK